MKEIEDKVAQVKENREWRLEYVTLLMRDQENQEIGIEIGKEIGREEGIRGTVSVLKGMNIPTQTILTKIQEQYNLSPEMSKKYL